MNDLDVCQKCFLDSKINWYSTKRTKNGEKRPFNSGYQFIVLFEYESSFFWAFKYLEVPKSLIKRSFWMESRKMEEKLLETSGYVLVAL